MAGSIARLPAVSRPHPWRRFGVVLLVLLVLALAAGGVRGYLRARSLDWQVRRGLELLQNADTPRTARAALDRWENETRPVWERRVDELVTCLFSRYSLDDHRVRLLLARVSGVDYGDRRADWKRWYETQQHLRAGRQPSVPRHENVRLEPQWQAAVGLTSWFTTILPLDGQIYVASLGARFDDPQDTADGVVRIDGATGQAELIFSTSDRPTRGPRDVIGLAAGERRLFVACLNGSVYAIDPQGQMLWETHVGSPVVAPPLSVDINRDGTSDMLVVTRSGKVLALLGQSGRTAWVANVSRPPAGTDLLGATLALTDALGGQGTAVLVTTPLGDVELLGLSNGRSRWRTNLSAGTLTGAVCLGKGAQPGPPVYVGDRAARVWSVLLTGSTLQTTIWGAPALRREETLIAALRTLDGDPNQPPAVLACTTGEYGDRRSGICLLDPEGVRWRAAVPGTVWGAPAVADLSGDGRVEILVPSIEPVAEGRACGGLTVFSHEGHILQRLTLEAAVECPPVVADVDGNHRLEVLVADQAGYLHCYKTDRYGPVRWGLAAGDSHNTRNASNAFAFGQTPFGYQWAWRPE